jgi:AbrB family looped-hinge helix DNA binding protein
MNATSTTTLSSKGQVVIPEEIRDRLKLSAGDRFVVLAERDVVILKVLNPPALKEFAPLLAKTRRAAKNTQMRPREISAAIAKVRRSR